MAITWHHLASALMIIPYYTWSSPMSRNGNQHLLIEQNGGFQKQVYIDMHDDRC